MLKKHRRELESLLRDLRADIGEHVDPREWEDGSFGHRKARQYQALRTVLKRVAERMEEGQ